MKFARFGGNLTHSDSPLIYFSAFSPKLPVIYDENTKLTFCSKFSNGRWQVGSLIGHLALSISPACLLLN